MSQCWFKELIYWRYCLYSSGLFVLWSTACSLESFIHQWIWQRLQKRLPASSFGRNRPLSVRRTVYSFNLLFIYVHSKQQFGKEMTRPEVLRGTHPQNQKKYERTVCSANARSIGAMEEECYTSDYCALFKTRSPATELEESVKVHQTSVEHYWQLL